MKQLHLEQTPASPHPPTKHMSESDGEQSTAASTASSSELGSDLDEPRNRSNKAVPTTTRLLKRSPSDPGFGSWCDDSSTDEDENDGDDSSDSEDHITINMASLSLDENYSSFYFSYCVERRQTSTSFREENENDDANFDEDYGHVKEDDDDDDQEQHDEFIRIAHKRHVDESIVMDNLSRRKLSFAEEPRVRIYEPAPYECHNDMYYSCHQLQKMMDAYNEGRDFELDE